VTKLTKLAVNEARSLLRTDATASIPFTYQLNFGHCVAVTTANRSGQAEQGTRVRPFATTGLSEDEVKRRAASFGPNSIEVGKQILRLFHRCTRHGIQRIPRVQITRYAKILQTTSAVCCFL
jgi:hypothetical protein